MANQNLTSEQTQFIMNRVKHTGIDALDVIPYTLSADGLSATPVSSNAPLPVTAQSYPVAAAWDYTALVQAATTDTWTFKTGGAGGTTVATVVITYTDATKATISNVARS